MGTLYALSDPRYVIFVSAIVLGLLSQGLKKEICCYNVVFNCKYMIDHDKVLCCSIICVRTLKAFVLLLIIDPVVSNK